MITEDYISFETAKLLKEKGFDEDTEHEIWYVIKQFSTGCHWNYCTYKVGDITREYDDNCCISMPTLQTAMKWLREVQGLNIYARGVWKDAEVSVYGDWEPVVVGYEWFVESLTDDTYSKISTEQFLTYEQACEAAIKYCLENLI